MCSVSISSGWTIPPMFELLIVRSFHIHTHIHTLGCVSVEVSLSHSFEIQVHTLNEFICLCISSLFDYFQVIYFLLFHLVLSVNVCVCVFRFSQTIKSNRFSKANVNDLLHSDHIARKESVRLRTHNNSNNK